MRKQQALGVLGIAQTVVEQVPVQRIGASVGRMAARTALPALEANQGVVEEHLAPTLGCHCGLWPEGNGGSLVPRIGAHVNHGHAVGT